MGLDCPQNLYKIKHQIVYWWVFLLDLINTHTYSACANVHDVEVRRIQGVFLYHGGPHYSFETESLTKPRVFPFVQGRPVVPQNPAILSLHPLVRAEVTVVCSHPDFCVWDPLFPSDLSLQSYIAVFSFKPYGQSNDITT